MRWPAFRRSPSIDPFAAWWRDADAAARTPSGEAVGMLRDALAATDGSDEHDRRREMIDGLEALVVVAAEPLPVVRTQHRVIGADDCHFMAPVTLVDAAGAAGKVFVTSTRLVFAAGGVKTWPWHRIRTIDRAGRDLVVAIAGTDEPVVMRFNSYGDALVAAHLADRARA